MQLDFEHESTYFMLSESRVLTLNDLSAQINSTLFRIHISLKLVKNLSCNKVTLREEDLCTCLSV